MSDQVFTVQVSRILSIGYKVWQNGCNTVSELRACEKSI